MGSTYIVSTRISSERQLKRTSSNMARMRGNASPSRRSCRRARTSVTRNADDERVQKKWSHRNSHGDDPKTLEKQQKIDT